jgi:hypothetical protein
MNVSQQAPTVRRVFNVVPEPEKLVIKCLHEIVEQRYAGKRKVLTDRLGWDETKLSKLLNGVYRPRLDDVMALCTVMSIPLSQVLRQCGM